MVKRQAKPVGDILLHPPHLLAKFRHRQPRLGRCQFRRGAVLVGGADEQDLVAAGPAEPGIGVRRQLRADQVAQMLDAVDVGQGRGDENARHRSAIVSGCGALAQHSAACQWATRERKLVQRGLNGQSLPGVATRSALIDWLEPVLTFLRDENNRGAIEITLAVLAGIGAIWVYFTGRIGSLIGFLTGGKREPAVPTNAASVHGHAQVGAAIGQITGGVVTVTTTPIAHVTLALDDYEARLAARINEALKARDAAHGGDRALLHKPKLMKVLLLLTDILLSLLKPE